jgi:branched-chain amino acid transport system ATP-binding protein
MLEMTDVVGGYGEKRILNKISLQVSPGEIIGLVGPNGSGKSTILKSIYGLVKVEEGDIVFMGKKIQNRKSSINAAEGIGYVPQGSKIFDRITVYENLELGGYVLKDRRELLRRIEEVYELFPVLKIHRNRIAGKMSGGERQILGISRGLIQKPKLILLDEPSIGLAPKLVSITTDAIRKIREQFRVTILVVEQNVREVLKVIDRAYVIRLGEIVLEQDKVDTGTEKKIREVFLG